MSSRRRGNNNSPMLDLKLNLSPPLVLNEEVDEPTKASSWIISPENSCLTSELEDAADYSKEGASMVLVGCPRCLMYVMLSEIEPKCPRCNSSVLLHLFNSQENKPRTNSRT